MIPRKSHPVRISPRMIAVAFAMLVSTVFCWTPADAEVRWRSGARSSPAKMLGAQLESAFVELSAVESHRRVVVHFDAPLDAEQRAALASSGIQEVGVRVTSCPLPRRARCRALDAVSASR